MSVPKKSRYVYYYCAWNPFSGTDVKCSFLYILYPDADDQILRGLYSIPRLDPLFSLFFSFSLHVC